MNTLILRGAREHNLRDIDLDLPLGSWIAVTGPSGSGKTTLVHDTLVRESRTRFFSSWSTKARQRLGKLGRADVDVLHGLPVAISIGSARLHRSERSTVGTLGGTLDLLRLVFARDATPEATRADFSFNGPGACEDCKGLGVQDVIDIEKLVVNPARSIRDGALGPTLANGYTVYSQVTVEVLDQVCHAHGFSVDMPWNQLTDAQHDVILRGSKALLVPFGKHSLESRLKWDGIPAKPREEGYYRGLLPVMTDTLKRSRNPNILRYATSRACPTCDGDRLGPVGRQRAIEGLTLPALSRLPLADVIRWCERVQGPTLDSVRRPLTDRLNRAIELGLGHLSLARRSTTLSDGELQRLRLVHLLGLRMSKLLLCFDEPTLGLHPDDLPALAHAMRSLRDQGNTVITVDHHPHFVGLADHLVDLGPGAGPNGGVVVRAEPMPADPLPKPMKPRPRRRPTHWMDLSNARLRNVDTDARFALDAFNVVSGPSGAGKSTLVFDLLLPALNGRSGAPTVLGQEGRKVQHIDARPLGQNRRSTPATYTGVFDLLRKRFASCAAAKEAGFTASHFSYNHASGRCPDCEGLGVVRAGLHLLRDDGVECSACRGLRYNPSVLSIEWNGIHIGALLQTSIEESMPLFAGDPALLRIASALVELGLGHLQWGRPTTSISRGEAQRVRLAKHLGQERNQPTVLLLDEPGRGLHPADLSVLTAGLRRLVDAGHTLIVISHHPAVWAMADHHVEMRDGRAGLPSEPKPLTLPPNVSAARVRPTLEGVRTRGLPSMNLTLVPGELLAVTGPSGSGKTSLVLGTLVAESERRFSEMLPFEVRRHRRQLARPSLERAAGLTPVLALSQRGAPSRRGTIGTQTHLMRDLRLLFARAGTLHGARHTLRADDFLASAGCTECRGSGVIGRASIDKLSPDDTKSIAQGAFAATRPGTFFLDENGRYVALLRAVDPSIVDRPWGQLTRRQQGIVLQGHPERIQTTWSFKRGKREGTQPLDEHWTGLLALVESESAKRSSRKDAERWASPLEAVPCSNCEGTGLHANAAQVQWHGSRFTDWARAPLNRLQETIQLTNDERVGPLLEAMHGTLKGLLDMGLGNLSLATPLSELAPSEAQRVRLSAILSTECSDITLVLDEPTSGLSSQEKASLMPALRGQLRAGNTLVVVTHDPWMVDQCDRQLDLDGFGRVAHLGAPVGLGPAPEIPAEIDVMRGTYAQFQAEVARRREAGETVVEPTVPSGSTIGFATGWMKHLQTLFAAESGRHRSVFSTKSPKGRCPTCKGAGHRVVPLDALPDLELPCTACDATGYQSDSLDVRVGGRNIHELLQSPIRDLHDVCGFEAAHAEAVSLRIGHLPLGRRIRDLAGGEQQRIGLWTLSPQTGRTVAWSEPWRGLHPADIQAVCLTIQHRIRRGEHFLIWAP